MIFHRRHDGISNFGRKLETGRIGNETASCWQFPILPGGSTEGLWTSGGCPLSADRSGAETSPLCRGAGAAAHCWGQGATPIGRVQGGSACRESKGQRPWPSEVLKAKRPEGVRHFVMGITCRNRSSSGERKQLRQGNKQPNKREGGDHPSQIKSSGYPVTMAVRESTASTTPGTTTAAST